MHCPAITDIFKFILTHSENTVKTQKNNYPGIIETEVKKTNKQ